MIKIKNSLQRGLQGIRRLAAFTAILIVCQQHSVLAQLPAGFVQKNLTDNSIKEATCMAHAPDGRIFIAERGGIVKVFQNGTLSVLHTVATTTAAEQGLLGITLHANFAQNGKCYIYYTNPELTTHFLDVIVIAANNTITSSTRLVQFDPIINGYHNGGAMWFKNGFLYLCNGESNEPAEAANLNSDRGKVLRFLEDGQPAPGNPYYNTAGANRSKKSIWAIGMRNPWAMSYDPLSGRMFVANVGGGFEEINDITNPDPAKNYDYGWDQRGRSGTDQDPNTTIAPFFAYRHENWGCAITTVAAFNPPSTNYPAQYKNRIYLTDWCSGWLRSIDLNNPTAPYQEFAPSGFGSILGTSVGADGNIYYINYNSNGSLARLEYTIQTAPIIVNQPVSKTIFTGDPVSFSVSASGLAPFTYQWKKNGVNITGATASTYSISSAVIADAGNYTVTVTNTNGNVTSNAAVLNVNPANTIPVAHITSPINGAKFTVLDVINFSGTATDQEDGTLPASAYTWEVRQYHKDCPTCEHWHPGPGVPNGVTSGSFISSNGGETSPNIWLRIILSVKDSNGRLGKDSVDIFPNLATVTAKSIPAGLKIVVGSEDITPYSKTMAVNAPVLLQAITPQIKGDSLYTFVSWAHGGAASQDIRVPAVNTTYTATFTSSFIGQRPYGNVIRTLPGKIEAEDFDEGGEGIAYHDGSAGNAGNAYRTSDNVDIQNCSEGTFNLGWVNNGEWLEYTVNVAQNGNYDLGLRIATQGTGKKMHVEVDGVNVTGTLAIPLTGSFQTWQTVTVSNISLTAGAKVIRIFFEENDINFNYFTFTVSGNTNTPPSVTIISPEMNETLTAPASKVIVATATDDGTIAKVEFYNGTIKLGEDLTAPYNYSWTNIPAGTYSLTAKAYDNLNALTTSSAITFIVTPTTGTPTKTLPGKIEAEDYDEGGEGVGYHDLSAGNSGNKYRPTDNVDIEDCSEGTFNIGWTNAGEWLQYTASVTQAGTYTLALRAAAQADGKALHVEINGVNITGAIAVPNSGGYQNWQTITIGNIALTTGTKVIRLVFDANDINLNYFSFTATGSTNALPVVSLTSPLSGDVFNAPAAVTLSATATDDGTISKVEFYNGAVKLGEDLTTPYSYSWTNVTAGSYAITAKAYDNLNASASSTVTNITVNTPAGSNLALNKPARASSRKDNSVSRAAGLAVDGQIGTRWESEWSNPQWIYIDLLQTYNLNRVKITWENALGKDYLIQVSNDSTNWTAPAAKTVTGNTVKINDWAIATTGRYIRIYGTVRNTQYGYSIFELEVYGTASSLRTAADDHTVGIVYPNPTTDVLNLEGLDENLSDVRVTMTDAYGNKVYDQRFANSSIAPIGIKNFTAGVYMLNVYAKDEFILSRQFIKQ
ncbi:MAG: PQQ-dependent sugar dehydrogenase [Cytophagaceae bacterium]|nr:PQQ-dependent sugar dehydrogenase [Cytophagaceae bacterium]